MLYRQGWRYKHFRCLHSTGFRPRKEGGSLPGGCLSFLAQGLTKVQKPRMVEVPKKRSRSWEQVCEDGPDDQFDDDEDELKQSMFQPAELKECRDPQLRAALDSLLELRLRADARTYAEILRECGKKQALLEGKQVHAHICKGGYEPDTYLGNLLVLMYGNCGSVEEARLVFDGLSFPNVYSWNIMIAAYAQNGYLQDATNIFESMPTPNVVSWNAIVAAYAQNGLLQEARSMFEKTPDRNLVSWNNIIAAYTHTGHVEEALKLFRRMDVEGIQPNRVTFLHVLDACSSISEGVMVHKNILENSIVVDIAVATALVIMYGRCGYPEAARYVFDKLPMLDVIVWTAMIVGYAQNGNLQDAKLMFDRMPERNVVSWTAMVAAYAQNGSSKGALQLFRVMDLEGVQPNKITFISALDACANLSTLAYGKIIHANVVDQELQSYVAVGNALINMYGKCGSLENAQVIFLKMPRKNVISWSALIASYAQNEQPKTALELFRTMQLEGVRPNEITLISILSACSHAGLYLDGVRYFLTVPGDYELQRIVDHYTCVVDILGRSGLLDKAEDLLNNMPFQPDVPSWMALLGACKTYGNVERGERAAEHLRKLDPTITCMGGRGQAQHQLVHTGQQVSF